MGATTMITRARIAQHLGKSLGYHKYISKKRNAKGEWEYTYDEPAPTNHRAHDADLDDVEDQVIGLIRRGHDLVSFENMDEYERLYKRSKEEREADEQAGYSFTYYSIARPLHGSSLSAEGIDGIARGRVVTTKHPLGWRELAALELVPAPGEEAGHAMIDLYHHKYGDGPIFLRRERPTRRGPNPRRLKDPDEEESIEAYKKRVDNWKDKRLSAIVHLSTREGKYQATHLDADGYSGHEVGDDLAALVGSEISRGNSIPASPDDYDDQVNSDRFTAGEAAVKQAHAEHEAWKKKFHEEYQAKYQAERAAEEEAKKAEQERQKAEVAAELQRQADAKRRSANAEYEQQHAERKAAVRERAPTFGSEPPRQKKKKAPDADPDQAMMFSTGDRAMRARDTLSKAGKPVRSINIDADLDNADWTKQSWDLLDVNSPKQLRAYLKKRGMTVEHFKALPIYKRNVDKIPWLKSMIKKSQAGTVADTLRKARKGETVAGHKYQARTWDRANGHWTYQYKPSKKAPSGHLTADHIFAAFESNKNATLADAARYAEYATGESAPDQADMLRHLDTAIYGINWSVSSGRVSGTVASYLKELKGKELAKFVAGMLPHIKTSGDVPGYLNSLWPDSAAQNELAEQVIKMKYGENPWWRR